MRIVLIVLTTLLLSLSAAGCGSKETPQLADVQGKVTYKGKPLPGGTVVFQTPDGQQRGVGPIGPDGTYTLKSPIGTVHAAVVTRPASRDHPGGPNRPAIREVAMPAGVNPNLLPPAKYESFDSSELRYEVKPGPNTIHITLE